MHDGNITFTGVRYNDVYGHTYEKKEKKETNVLRGQWWIKERLDIFFKGTAVESNVAYAVSNFLFD